MEICELPNGCTLFRKENAAGGHTYYSDEVGGGVAVWDTCLVDPSTLLAAITEENRWRYAEAMKKDKNSDICPDTAAL